MQIVNFGSEKFMDLVDALSMLVPEVMHTQQGYQPFSRINKDDPASKQNGEYKSPYKVDISEEGLGSYSYYDPLLEYRGHGMIAGSTRTMIF